MSVAYLNKQFTPLDEARISPLDRGFLFADGVYEVIPVYAGIPFRLTEHLERLEFSLAEVAIHNPHSRTEWQVICEQLIEKNGGGNLSIYLQITRGVPTKRDHAFPQTSVEPTVFAMTHAMDIPMAANPDTALGAKAITLNDLRWQRCDIKSIALLPNILLRQQAVSAGAMEAILIKDGNAVEGAASNLFIVKNNIVITPPSTQHILGGITRDVMIELCQDNGITILEQDISEAELHQADEVWVTSSTKEVVSIVELDGNPVANGEPGVVWQRVAALYSSFRRQLCGWE